MTPEERAREVALNLLRPMRHGTRLPCCCKECEDQVAAALLAFAAEQVREAFEAGWNAAGRTSTWPVRKEFEAALRAWERKRRRSG